MPSVIVQTERTPTEVAAPGVARSEPAAATGTRARHAAEPALPPLPAREQRGLVDETTVPAFAAAPRVRSVPMQQAPGTAPPASVERRAQPTRPPAALRAETCSNVHEGAAPSIRDAKRGAPLATVQSKVALRLGAALAVGAAVGLRYASRLPVADVHPPAEARAAMVLGQTQEIIAQQTPPSPPQEDTTLSPAGAAAKEAKAESAAQAVSDWRRSPLDLAPLSDSQLVQLFGLEQQREVPACSGRLDEGAARHAGNPPKTSRAHLNAARRALQRGELDTAHTELCAATARDSRNVDAQRSLAELALDLGDPARAREAAERGLSRAPTSIELLGVLGDAVAMLGDLAESRMIWLETVEERGSEAQRRRRLAASYQKAGERALVANNFARARSYFRRALILTHGGHEPSLGLAEALLWLEQPRAGLAWAERAARAQLKNARAQIVLGDAHAKNGALDSARAAWRAAQRADPSNQLVARRLGHRPR